MPKSDVIKYVHKPMINQSGSKMTSAHVWHSLDDGNLILDQYVQKSTKMTS